MGTVLPEQQKGKCSRRESSVPADAAQVARGRSRNPPSRVCFRAALWSCAVQTQRGDPSSSVAAEVQGTVGAPGKGTQPGLGGKPFKVTPR